MPEFKKKNLLEKLEQVYEIHILGLASVTFLLRDKTLELLKQNNMMYYGQVHFLKDLVEELSNNETRVNKTTKLIESSKLFFLTEPINIINDYFKTNSIQRPWKCDWYLFGNTIRNYFTHGSLDYDNNFKKHNISFPISWQGNIITENDVKTSQIDVDKFSNTYPLDLFNEIQLFAKNLPKN